MLRTIFAIALVAAQGTLLFAQEAKDKKNELPKVEMLTLKVRVLDPDDHPVEGATVMPRGLRTKINKGNWWSWVERRDGPTPKILTDSAGIAEVPYPKYTYEKMEVGTVNLYITHPDFVSFNDDRGVGNGPATVNLKRGFRIAVTAIDAVSGEKIKTDLYGFISVPASGKWEQKKGGILVSPTLKKQKCILRLAQFEEGKPTKFSDRIDITPGDRSRVLLKDVKLAVGARVTGKLDESVPRPVKAGLVAASIDLDADAQRGGRNRWRWHDKAVINADGTFVFESLPKDEILQFIAVCDGWAATKPQELDVLKFFPDELNALNNNRVFPYLIRTEDDTPNITLPMTQTKSLKVTVLDPDGNPLSRAKVWSNPNQYWFGGSSNMVGAASSSREFKVDPENAKNRRQHALERFLFTTDETGEAIMSNIPDTGFPLTLGAGHGQYELPNLFGDREVIARLKDDGYADVTMRMQKKGADVIDGEHTTTQAQIRENANAVKNVLEGLFK